MNPRRTTARRDPGPRWPAVRAGFSLTELLVAVSIILVLASILAGAVAGARGSQKKAATAILIGKLNTIIQQQYSTYASRSGPRGISAAARGAWLRRLISSELPDSFADLEYLWSNTDLYGPPPSGTVIFAASQLTGPQRSYLGIWNRQRTTASSQFGDAECLFMIVMQGGIANCLDCSQLRTAQIGDVDNDQMPEFLDDWGNPIRYVLWPAFLELPPASGVFFSASPPFASGSPASAPGGTMRPLIFSGGPDQRNSILANETGNLSLPDCGNPAVLQSNGLLFGGLDSPPDGRADNVTNFDDEVKR